ncbi:MAG: hypothetical protein Q4C76_00700 [Bacillota bacterium]|nr:hypothetical protein [Bacillota bacterium]
MLRKLMKHELRATARLMLPLYLVVLLLSVGARFSTAWLDTTPTLSPVLEKLLNLVSILVVMGFVVGLIAVFAVALVLMIQRFRSNLLGDEGYVMFTLPVSPHQLVWSKLLISTLWFAGAAIVDTLALLILVVDQSFFRNLQEILQRVLEDFNSYYAAHGVLVAVEVILLCVVAAINLCLEFYAPLSIGHSFDRHKMLLSVVFFFVIQIAAQMAAGILLLAVRLPMNAVSNFINSQPPEVALHAGLWFAILSIVVYNAVLYVINHRMLSRKLNLE